MSNGDFPWVGAGCVAAVVLIAVGIAAAVVSGGDNTPATPPDPSVKIYASVADCVSGGGAQDECEKALKAATDQHEQNAPRFASTGSCEERYGQGNCVRRGEGASDFFIPYMMGYMMGWQSTRRPAGMGKASTSTKTS